MPKPTTPADPSLKLADWAEHFLPLLRPFRVPLLLATLAMVGDALLTVLRPWPLKVILDRVLSHRHARVPVLGPWLEGAHIDRLALLRGCCAVTLLIALGTGLLTYFYTGALGDVGQRFVFALRRELFAHMQRLSLRFHDRQRNGDLITRLTSDVRSIQDVMVDGAITVVSNCFLLLGMLILMLWLDWRFALAALSVAPLLFFVIFRYTQRIKVAARTARKSDGLVTSIAQETLSSIRVVQGLAQEDQQDERFGDRSSDSLQAYLDGVRYQARAAPLVDILAAAGMVIVMYYGATRVLAGTLTVGDMLVFFAYVTNLYAPMKALARFSYSLNKASIGAERIIEVLRIRREVADLPDAQPAPRLRGAVELRHVTFEYLPDRPVLSDVNLCIAPGEKVAIVGTTGAGKSTLVSLLPRLYDVTKGTILIDGEDIRHYQVQSLREQVSLVLQDSLLFSGTIRENIAFARPDAREDEIVAAALVANAHEFITRLPEGYETLVAERGTTLSGGQKQRVAIARAILRDAPILILDEPTSGLDAASERIVIEALELASRGRTTLLIAHRLSTVRIADRIVVLEEGRIVESGTHIELMARDGRYAHLYRFQFATEPLLTGSLKAEESNVPALPK